MAFYPNSLPAAAMPIPEKLNTWQSNFHSRDLNNVMQAITSGMPTYFNAVIAPIFTVAGQRQFQALLVNGERFPGGRVLKVEMQEFPFYAEYVRRHLHLAESAIKETALEIQSPKHIALDVQQQQSCASAALRHLISWLGANEKDVRFTANAAPLLQHILSKQCKLIPIGRRTVAKLCAEAIDHFDDRGEETLPVIGKIQTRTQYFVLNLGEISAEMAASLAQTNYKPTSLEKTAAKYANTGLIAKALLKPGVLNQLTALQGAVEEKQSADPVPMGEEKHYADVDHRIWDQFDQYEIDGCLYQFGYARRIPGANIDADLKASQNDHFYRPVSPMLRIVNIQTGEVRTLVLSKAWFTEEIKNDACYFLSEQGRFKKSMEKVAHFIAAFKHDANTINMPHIQRIFMDKKRILGDPESFRARVDPSSREFNATLFREYQEEIINYLKDVGGSKGKTNAREYVLKLHNMDDRARFIIPDFDIDSFLIQILQMSYKENIPGFPEQIKQVLNPDGTINHKALAAVLKADEWLVPLSFLEGIGAYTKLAQQQLKKRLKTLKDVTYVTYPKLPQYMVTDIKEKALKHVSLHAVMQHWHQQSRAKMLNDGALYRGRFRRSTYRTYNPVTKGLNNRYSPECFGADLEGAGATEAELKIKRSDAQKKHDESLATFEETKKAIQAYVEHRRAKRDEEATKLALSEIIFSNKELASMIETRIGMLHMTAEQIANEIQQQLLKESKANFQLAMSSYPGFGQFVWGEVLVSMKSTDSVLAFEVSSDKVRHDIDAKYSSDDIPRVFHSQFGGKDLPNFELATLAQRGFENFARVFKSLGLDQVQLQQGFWHERMIFTLKHVDAVRFYLWKTTALESVELPRDLKDKTMQELLRKIQSDPANSSKSEQDILNDALKWVMKYIREQVIVAAETVVHREQQDRTMKAVLSGTTHTADGRTICRTDAELDALSPEQNPKERNIVYFFKGTPGAVSEARAKAVTAAARGPQQRGV